jgi:hypothetical protein
VDRALLDEEIRRRLAGAGALPAGGSATQAQAFHHGEIAKWGRVVQVSGARVE